jgi:hypothetical protein
VRQFFIPFIFALSLLSGCSILNPNRSDTDEYRTVREDRKNPAFQAENKPMRILSLAVVYEEGVTEESIRSAFADASFLLEDQVGVKLELTLFARKKFEARSFGGVRRDMNLFHETHPDHDLYVGVISPTNFEEQCIRNLCVEAEISIGWRHVAVKLLKPNFIAHEIGHALLQEAFHSPTGLMGVPVSGNYFTRANRKTILRNKWRNFRE